MKATSGTYLCRRSALAVVLRVFITLSKDAGAKVGWKRIRLGLAARGTLPPSSLTRQQLSTEYDPLDPSEQAHGLEQSRFRITER